MADIAGVQNKIRLLWKSIDLVHRSLQCCDHVGIGGLVESHVAVANLHETEFSHFVGLHLRAHLGGQSARCQHASLNNTEGTGASPRHALQKATAVDSVIIMVVLDESSSFRI